MPFGSLDAKSFADLITQPQYDLIRTNLDFLAARVGHIEASPRKSAYTTVGDYYVAASIANGTDYVYFTFRIPDDFASLDNAVVICHTASAATIVMGYDTDYGNPANAENYNAGSETAATINQGAKSANKLFNVNVASVLTGVAAGDVVGLRIASDATSGATSNIISFYAEYTKSTS